MMYYSGSEKWDRKCWKMLWSYLFWAHGLWQVWRHRFWSNDNKIEKGTAGPIITPTHAKQMIWLVMLSQVCYVAPGSSCIATALHYARTKERERTCTRACEAIDPTGNRVGRHAVYIHAAGKFRWKETIFFLLKKKKEAQRLARCCRSFSSHNTEQRSWDNAGLSNSAAATCCAAPGARLFAGWSGSCSRWVVWLLATSVFFLR